LGVFTSDGFLRAYALARGAEPVYGSQMWIVRRAFVKMAECSPWNGFIEEVNTDTILGTARKHRAWVVTFTSQSLVDDKRLQSLTPSPTFLTFPDFTPGKKLRWSIRKASDLNATIEPGNWKELQKPLSHLWERLGRAIPAEFYSLLEGAGDGHAILARVKGETVAGLFYLTDYDKASYMYSLATEANFRGSEITSFLVFSFLKAAFDQGAPYVDLCGASVPSLYAFKKQFASTIAWRPRYIGVMNPLWRLVRLKAAYMYQDQSAHIPEKERWRDYLVKNLIAKRGS
jgi:hypothetical protein